MDSTPLGRGRARPINREARVTWGMVQEFNVVLIPRPPTPDDYAKWYREQLGTPPPMNRAAQ